MKRVAATPGDPAGVGPEALAASLVGALPPDTAVVVAATGSLLRARATTAGLGGLDFLREIGHPSQAEEPGAYVVDIPCPAGAAVAGRSSVESARAALEYLERAAAWAEQGAVAALVTGPLSKQAIWAAGLPFLGHTEFLAARVGVRAPVMMFVGGGLRVALATTHVALRRVAAMVTGERIQRAIRALQEALAGHFGIAMPRIGVLGLNPHAGDGGLFGREDADVVAPAIHECAGEGIAVHGPLAADTAFRRARAGEFDGLVAMYHDQALPVVKSLATDAVNVTLGLPYIRTAPDHGPAYDAAGRPGVRWESTAAALRLAAQLAAARR